MVGGEDGLDPRGASAAHHAGDVEEHRGRRFGLRWWLLKLGRRLCEDNVGGFSTDFKEGELSGARKGGVGVRVVGGVEVGVE